MIFLRISGGKASSFSYLSRVNQFRANPRHRIFNRLVFYTLVVITLRVCGYLTDGDAGVSQTDLDENLGVAKPYIAVPVEKVQIN